MATHLILGTAGHIDHGKTALVRALTGIETDRLPEEKKRGITIDLGFASIELGNYILGIVDVPGHERFVRNMLAGATGIDVALLVIAADDSVKPQTREHLEILKILNLSAGVIALTKCDVADADWIDLVEAEVRELVQDTFLSDAAIVRTSSLSGMGIESLKKELLRSIEANVPLDAARTAGLFAWRWMELFRCRAMAPLREGAYYGAHCRWAMKSMSIPATGWHACGAFKHTAMM